MKYKKILIYIVVVPPAPENKSSASKIYNIIFMQNALSDEISVDKYAGL